MRWPWSRISNWETRSPCFGSEPDHVKINLLISSFNCLMTDFIARGIRNKVDRVMKLHGCREVLPFFSFLPFFLCSIKIVERCSTDPFVPSYRLTERVVHSFVKIHCRSSNGYLLFLVNNVCSRFLSDSWK